MGDCASEVPFNCMKGNCSTLVSDVTISQIDSCSAMNFSTCSNMMAKRQWVGELSYDEDGCFDNYHLRTTEAYDVYLKVRAPNIVLIIGPLKSINFSFLCGWEFF